MKIAFYAVDVSEKISFYEIYVFAWGFSGSRRGKEVPKLKLKSGKFFSIALIFALEILLNFQLNTPIDQPMRVHVSKSWIFYRCDNHELWLIISLTLWSARSTCRWLLTCIKVGKLLVITCESQWTYLEISKTMF